MKPPTNPSQQEEREALREAIWKKLEWYFGGDRQNMRVASKDLCDLVDKYTAQREHRLVVEARINELEDFKPLYKYDHAQCPDPKTCIGYQNAQSDFDNEKEIRLTKFKKELRDAGNVQHEE